MKENFVLIVAFLGAIFGAKPQTRINYGNICDIIDCSKSTTKNHPMTKTKAAESNEPEFGTFKPQIVHLRLNIFSY